MIINCPLFYIEYIKDIELLLSAMKDHDGLDISTDSPDILNLVEKFKTDLLSMGKGWITPH